MKKAILFTLATILLLSCKENVISGTEPTATVQKTGAPDTAVALQFINSYVTNCNKMKESLSTDEWIATSPYATDKLKKKTKVLIDEAEREDPEYGLGFDPIFDAQDYPEEGFEIESADAKTGYIIVRGKEWKEFRLAMVLKQEDGKWMVDGCGVVNVPEEKRIAR